MFNKRTSLQGSLLLTSKYSIKSLNTTQQQKPTGLHTLAQVPVICVGHNFPAERLW